ncbi:MAG: hypothetical protein PHW63_06660 [Alphaproteobacteria bacterium]|nr:hypothetical protein [Alphaproteobacteria bacterium]
MMMTIDFFNAARVCGPKESYARRTPRHWTPAFAGVTQEGCADDNK